MQKLTANDPESHSPNLIRENVERLKALFPELLTEGPNGISVNVDVLKQLVGDQTVTDADEKYGLSWHGKRRARQLALTPSTGTLRPCPEDSVDWETTQNLFIEGDNLEVLKLLQKSYAGKVKLIYIDPPYNTGNDFVYPDAFQDSIKNYLELTGQIEGGRKMTTHTETSGRFHTEWLNMMYPRLLLSKNLLSNNGLILLHIDEHEVHSLTKLMQDLYGEENELGVLIWDKRNPKGDSRGISYQHESLILFAKDKNTLLSNTTLSRPKTNAEKIINNARRIIESSKTIQDARVAYRQWIRNNNTLSGGEAMYDRISDSGRVYRLVSMAWPNKKQAPSDYFKPLIHPITRKPCPVPERGWRNPSSTMESLLMNGQIEFGVDETTQPQRIYFLDENMYENIPSILPFGGSDDMLLKELNIPFEQPKPLDFVSSIISWVSGHHDLIMDFFAGSGTTGHAVMAQNAVDGGNRRYILVQLPEPLDPEQKEQTVAATFCDTLGKPRTIAELTKERLRRAGQQIARNAAKGRQETEAAPLFAEPAEEASGLDVGFRVFKLDSTNLREWDPQPESLETSLFESIDPIKPGRAEADVLYEVLLKWGLDLCVPIETRTIAHKPVHAVGGGVLMACLAESISREEAEALALGIAEWRTALDPAGETLCLFRDSAFEDDVAKTNLTALLAQQKITQVRSL